MVIFALIALGIALLLGLLFALLPDAGPPGQPVPANQNQQEFNLSPRARWYLKMVGIGLVIVAACTLVVSVVYTNPQPGTISVLSWRYVVPVLLFFLVAITVIRLLVPAEKKKDAQYALAAVLVFLLIMPILA